MSHNRGEPTMTLARRKRPRVAGFVVVALLAAAACGSDDDGGDAAEPDPPVATEAAESESPATTEAAESESPATTEAAESESPATTEPSEPAPEPVKIRLMHVAATLGSLPVFVAMGAGLFEDNAIEIDLLPYLPNGAQSALTTVTGDSDIARTSTAGLFAAVSANRPVVGIAATSSKTTLFITLSAQAAARLAEQGITADSPLEDRVKALEGLLIATSAAGGTAETRARTLMSDFGVDPDANSDQFIALTDLASAAGVVRTGDADAVISGVPLVLVPVVEGDGVLWISGVTDDIPSWVSSYEDVFVTSRTYVEENEEAVARFIETLNEAIELIESDPEAARAALTEFFPEMDPTLLDEAYEIVRPAFRPVELDAAGFAKAVEEYNKVSDKPLEESVTFEDVFVTAPLESLG